MLPSGAGVESLVARAILVQASVVVPRTGSSEPISLIDAVARKVATFPAGPTGLGVAVRLLPKTASGATAVARTSRPGLPVAKATPIAESGTESSARTLLTRVRCHPIPASETFLKPSVLVDLRNPGTRAARPIKPALTDATNGEMVRAVASVTATRGT